jgi:hypothetical protein
MDYFDCGRFPHHFTKREERQRDRKKERETL